LFSVKVHAPFAAKLKLPYAPNVAVCGWKLAWPASTSLMVRVPLVVNAVSSVTEPASTPMTLALEMTAASLVPLTVILTVDVVPSSAVTV
jgi:hypothetical protein